MARKKVDTPCRLKSWEDVDKAMHEIIEHESCINEINAEMNRQTATIKAAADADAKIHLDRNKALGIDIKEFVTNHREEINGKTKQLNFGKTGFRVSSSVVVPPNKVADVLAALKRYDMQDCINVKETVNKEVLKKYPTDQILQTGAYMKTTDEFWYETERHEVAET